MKRYLLFAFNQYYPQGGMNDFDSEYDTKKELKMGIHVRGADNWRDVRLQVFDSQEKRIIYKAESRGR